jgi:hypothetical protein
VGRPIILFGIAWAAIMGIIVFGLWNALIPAILGLPVISYWQALGLLLLTRILFGRFGGWSPKFDKARFVRGWKDLTPEERQRFSHAVGACGGRRRFPDDGPAEKV